MSDLAYFYVLKNEARKRTVEAFNNRLLKSGNIQRWSNLTLCSILGSEVGDALDYATNEWPKYYGENSHSGFAESWETIVHRYLPRKDHFDLAIWQEIEKEQVLVPLAIANPSHGRTHLTVKWIERFYGNNYLEGRALWPILTCAEEYAKLLGSERVLIKDPVDSNKYERYGYAPYAHPNVPYGGNYLAKELVL